VRWGVVAALLMVPSVAAAQEETSADAPFDLHAMRRQHPNAEAVILEQIFEVSMPSPEVLRWSRRRRIAILDDSGRAAARS
jgi:hypothetical protein